MVRGNDWGGVVDRSGSPKQVIFPSELDWVEAKVTRITFAFMTETSVADFLDRAPILKANASLNIISIEPCLPTESVSLGRSAVESPFFYMYSCLFSYLHISLSFDIFTMGVLQALNVAPT